jgi:hypothetical protein
VQPAELGVTSNQVTTFIYLNYLFILFLLEAWDAFGICKAALSAFILMERMREMAGATFCSWVRRSYDVFCIFNEWPMYMANASKK